MKRIALAWGIFFCLLPLAHSQTGGVTVELSLTQNQLLPDEKMHLKVSIQNQSGQNLKLGTESDYINFTVLDEKQNPVPPLGTNQVYTDGEVTIPSGETATREFNLTPAFDFRRPGHYSIKASVHVPQWRRDIPSTSAATFTVAQGTPVANMPNLQGGVPLLLGSSNALPEVRRYVLEKGDTGSGVNLYVRLLDESGHTVRLISTGPYFGYSTPEARLDQNTVLHLLHQTAAKDFTYHAIDALGQILERQTYEYLDSRPVLQSDGIGGVKVAGGVRKLTDNDLPPNEKETAIPAATFPGAKRN